MQKQTPLMLPLRPSRRWFLLLLVPAAVLPVMAAILPQSSEIAAVSAAALAAYVSFALCAACVLGMRPCLKVEQIFLLLAVGLALSYFFAITPLSVPDEVTHHRITLRIAARLLGRGSVVDAAYVDYTGMVSHHNTASAMLRLVNGLFTEGLSGQTVDLGAALGTSYPPAYAPQVLAACLCMLLGLNGLWVFVLGSLMNLALYVTLTYLAIRRMPRGKTVLMLTALLPMSLQQAASLSPDAFINGLAFLFIAQVLSSALARGPITRQEMLRLAVAGLLLAPAKAVYSVMLLLLLLIPSSRFSGRRRWALFIGLTLLLAAAAVIAFQMSWLLHQATRQTSALRRGAPRLYTLSWLLRHPLDALSLMVKTLVKEDAAFYLETCVGSRLSGLTLNVPNTCVMALLFLGLLAALGGQPEEAPLPRSFRLAFLGVTVLTLFAVMASMLVSWTGNRDLTVQGVQGRYFLPVAPLALLCLRGGSYCVRRDMTRAYAVGFLLIHTLILGKIYLLLCA